MSIEDQKRQSRPYAMIGWLVGVAGVKPEVAADMVAVVDPALDDQAFADEVCRPNMQLRGFLEGYRAAGGQLMQDER